MVDKKNNETNETKKNKAQEAKDRLAQLDLFFGNAPLIGEGALTTSEIELVVHEIEPVHPKHKDSQVSKPILPMAKEKMKPTQENKAKHYPERSKTDKAEKKKKKKK